MFRSTLLYLGIFTLFVSIFSLLNILFCFYFDSSINIKKIYFGCLLVSLLLSAIFIFSNKKYLNEKINFFERKNFTLLKKHINISVALFSGLKSGDYLFINNIYLKKNPVS